MTAVAPVVIDCDGLWVGWTGLDNFNTGYSFSESLIFASLNPKHDNRLFIELQVQHKQNYNFSRCSVHQIVFAFEIENDLMYTTCFLLLNLQFNKQSVVIFWIN